VREIHHRDKKNMEIRMISKDADIRFTMESIKGIKNSEKS
jgi:hypothetical protein